MNTHTRPSTSDYPLVTLASLEAELAAYFAAMAVMLDDCFKSGAGLAMLGSAHEVFSTEAYYSMVNVQETVIGKELPAWFTYAYEGRTPRGLNLNELDAVDGPFPRLVDMLGLLNVNDGYFEDCVQTAGAELPLEQSHLKDLVERVTALVLLDQGLPLELQQIAVLANMNERSVRNAVSTEGAQKLTLREDGCVEAATAALWLENRRGFVKRQKNEPAKRKDVLPESLSAYEIPHLLRERLQARVGDSGEGWLAVANDADIVAERLNQICRLPLSVKPHEIPGLARALDIDEGWLTRQVMFALYPAQMALLTAPAPKPPVVPSKKSEIESCTVVLDAAMLKHGYLDISAEHMNLFPSDSISVSKSPGDAAAQVEFMYGKERALTDIRTKSARTISPRKRFGSWFNRDLNAQPGDLIRIEKTAERSYALHYVAQ